MSPFEVLLWSISDAHEWGPWKTGETRLWNQPRLILQEQIPVCPDDSTANDPPMRSLSSYVVPPRTLARFHASIKAGWKG
jgi:hypothetical protein